MVDPAQTLNIPALLAAGWTPPGEQLSSYRPYLTAYYRGCQHHALADRIDQGAAFDSTDIAIIRGLASVLNLIGIDPEHFATSRS